MSLPARRRYAMLKNWVLPAATHPALRLQVDWLPLEALETAGAKGGDLISPALELVAVAKQLGKLDELSAAAALAVKEEPELARTANSFDALLAVARGDDKTATDRLNKAIAYVKAQPVDTPLHQRHAEYLAAYAAAALPLARTTALELCADSPRSIAATSCQRRMDAPRAATARNAHVGDGQRHGCSALRNQRRIDAVATGDALDSQGLWRGDRPGGMEAEAGRGIVHDGRRTRCGVFRRSAARRF